MISSSTPVWQRPSSPCRWAGRSACCRRCSSPPRSRRCTSPFMPSLIATLGAAGLQAEALSVFRTVRTRLAARPRHRPGPALEAAHRRVLNQTAPSTATERAPAMPGSGRLGGLVGRVDELAVLWQAVEPAFAGGTGLVVVEGEPGAGKTRLLRGARRRVRSARRVRRLGRLPRGRRNAVDVAVGAGGRHGPRQPARRGAGEVAGRRARPASCEPRRRRPHRAGDAGQRRPVPPVRPGRRRHRRGRRRDGRWCS